MRVLFLSLMVSVSALSLLAQTSELSGHVVDPSAQVVPGAEVTVTRAGTSAAQRTTTNDSGYFFFPNLIPGQYAVRVVKTGFKTLDRDGITLLTVDRLHLDLQLEIGSATDTITVTGDASLLELGSPSVNTSVNTREYDQLPQIQYNRMRSPATFLYLAPGVQGKITTA